MRKLVGHLIIATAAAVISSGIAGAADLPVKAPPPPLPPPFSWTGFYIGENVGGAWANGGITDDVTGFDFSTSHSGFIGGGQLGFNYQFSNIVFGFEGLDLPQCNWGRVLLPWHWGGSSGLSQYEVDFITSWALGRRV